MVIELVTESGGDPVARLPEFAFRAALRRDLWLLLDPSSHHLLEAPGLLIMSLPLPHLLFDFETWRRVFAAYLIPGQILMCAQGHGEWTIYNPVLLVSIRRH